MRLVKGTLLYEGFTIDDKPHGAGCAFFANGKKYKEGVFDCKGLVYGREYYSNGEVRFEGAYEICHGYGPNYPIYGSFYSKDGEEAFKGKFSLKFGGVGYPMVTSPEEYGPVPCGDGPDIHYWSWGDEENDES